MGALGGAGLADRGGSIKVTAARSFLGAKKVKIKAIR